jgi:hypothetical protein
VPRREATKNKTNPRSRAPNSLPFTQLEDVTFFELLLRRLFRSALSCREQIDKKMFRSACLALSLYFLFSEA